MSGWSGGMRSWGNVGTVARREYSVRVHTRSFLSGTALPVLGVVAIALLPVLIRYLDRIDTTRIAVTAPSATPALA